MDTPGSVVTLFRVGVWQALRRAVARGGVITPCVCVGRSGGRVRAVTAARKTAVCAPRRAPPGVLACRRGIKKRAACAALEIHGWNSRRHSGVCCCQCSIRRSRSLSEIIGTGVNVKPSGVR